MSNKSFLWIRWSLKGSAKFFVTVKNFWSLLLPVTLSISPHGGQGGGGQKEGSLAEQPESKFQHWPLLVLLFVTVLFSLLWKKVQAFPCGKLHCVLWWATGTYIKWTVFQSQFLSTYKQNRKYQRMNYVCTLVLSYRLLSINNTWISV